MRKPQRAVEGLRGSGSAAGAWRWTCWGAVRGVTVYAELAGSVAAVRATARLHLLPDGLDAWGNRQGSVRQRTIDASRARHLRRGLRPGGA